jgi:hypothetical protein
MLRKVLSTHQLSSSQSSQSSEKHSEKRSGEKSLERKTSSGHNTISTLDDRRKPRDEMTELREKLKMFENVLNR